MTSAARPTFLPAVGGFSLADTRVAPLSIKSAKAQPAHLTLKQRDLVENDPKTLKEILLQKELAALDKPSRFGVVEEDESFIEKRQQLLENNIDADDSADDSDSDSSSDDDSDDDQDDTAQLLAELEKIKKERALEKQKQEEEALLKQQELATEEAMQGNPLLASSQGFSVKRRWDEDVIFKNQAQGAPEQKKRFINDLLRSDFHRKFMGKYVK